MNAHIAHNFTSHPNQTEIMKPKIMNKVDMKPEYGAHLCKRTPGCGNSKATCTCDFVDKYNKKKDGFVQKEDKSPDR